jgi:DNA-binding transcriptional LysR family regulator
MIEPFDLNLRHLRALPAITASGSVRAAAEAVSLSQPALTQGLAKLERQLGVTLFDRRSDGMAATEGGRLLADRAAAAFERLGRAVRDASGHASRGFARAERLMTATQLRAFLALADAGSFTGAASATALSQPALHRAVRDLEQVGGFALVERRGRGIALTPAGRRLARGVRLVRADIAAGIAEIAPAEGDGRVVVGAMPFCRASLLPAAIARLLQETPRLRLDIAEGAWRELVEPLRDGAIDLMIGALRDPCPPDLTQHALLVDRLVVVGRADHPLVRVTSPGLDALAAFPWIVGRLHSPLRIHWERLFAGRALPPAPIECGSVLAMRGILQRSDCLTLVSPAQVVVELSGGLLARIGPPLVGHERTIGITTRADWRPTPVQHRFLHHVEAVAAETLQENQ